jgi:hypothetical protein
MRKKHQKSVLMPGDLKERVQRLARLNNITCCELVRLSISVKLADYETGRQPLNGVEMRDSVSAPPPASVANDMEVCRE